MLQDILTIARPVFQPTKKLDQLDMHTVRCDIECCLLSGLPHGNIKLFLHLLNNLFNPGRMYSAVHDQSFQCQPGHFPPHRIKAGKNDRLRGVVNYDIDTGCRLNGTDVPAFPADNPALHLLIGQGHDRHCFFSNIITGIS